MATRFYLQDGITPSITPVYDLNWAVTVDANRSMMIYEPILDATTVLLNKTINVPNLTSQNILARQYVSVSIPSQTISGSVSLIVSCTESGLTANCFLSLVVKVVSQDGLTIRSVLLTSNTNDLEFGTAAATRIVNAVALTPFTTQAGDRLVIEIGATVSTPATATAQFVFGSNAGSDFAFTSGLTTILNPYVEFSQNIQLSKGSNYSYLKVGNTMSRSEVAN